MHARPRWSFHPSRRLPLSHVSPMPRERAARDTLWDVANGRVAHPAAHLIRWVRPLAQCARPRLPTLRRLLCLRGRSQRITRTLQRLGKRPSASGPPRQVVALVDTLMFGGRQEGCERVAVAGSHQGLDFSGVGMGGEGGGGQLWAPRLRREQGPAILTLAHTPNLTQALTLTNPSPFDLQRILQPVFVLGSFVRLL